MVDARLVSVSACLLLMTVVLGAMSAWVLARGWHRGSIPLYRPIAWLLTWVFVADVSRASLYRWVLRPARALAGPAAYPWPASGAFHLEQALVLAWPVALVVAAVSIFLRRRALLPAISAWGALSLGFAAVYPWLRLARRETAHALVDSVALVLVAACAARSWAVAWKRREPWGPAAWAISWIAVNELAVLLVVLWWAAPGDQWEIARRIQQVGYGLLVVYQAVEIARSR